MPGKSSDFRIEALQERLTIQQPVDIADGMGGVTRSWQDVATVWGNLTPLTGRESVNADRLEAAVTHRVVLRYQSGITSAMRLSFAGRVFNIRSVMNWQEESLFLVLLVEEGVAV